VNLGGTAFVDGVTEPGWLLEEYFEYYTADRFQDADGRKLPGRNFVDAWASLQHVAWISKLQLLGGYYGWEVLLPIVGLDVGVDAVHDDRIDVGDIEVAPIFIQWPERKLFGFSYWDRLDLSLILPSGAYDGDAEVNVGTNVVGVTPYYAFTLFFTPRLETSFRLHYRWNSTNHDPPPSFAAGSIQPGQVVHFNGAVSYEVWPTIRIGINGYWLKQVTDGRIDGRAVPDSREQVASIGPGIGIESKWVWVYLHGFWEVGAENRPEGEKVVLRVLKIF
jgi:hypothetical protein